MRDNADGYPELVTAYERDGLYFAVTRVIRGSDSRTVEWGVSQAGYVALRRVFNQRPFDSLPGVRYRYYFVPTYGATDDTRKWFNFRIRIEQGRDGRDFDADGPSDLVANLVWFWKLESLQETDHLKPVPMPEPF